MAVCAAGSMGVGPGVNKRFFSSIYQEILCWKIVLVYRNQALVNHASENSREFYNRLSQDIALRITGVNVRLLRTVRFGAERYNPTMSLPEQIQQDIVAAMKARDEHRLSTLRMVKTALKNREVEKMAPLDDKEAQQVLTTLIKQRKDSVEQFTKGGRQEMADKEAAEIILIEAYMPKAAGEDQVVAGVRAVIAEMGAPTIKEMGAVMKNVMARFAGAGIRVDGKQVSDAVRQELSGK